MPLSVMDWAIIVDTLAATIGLREDGPFKFSEETRRDLLAYITEQLSVREPTTPTGRKYDKGGNP